MHPVDGFRALVLSRVMLKALVLSFLLVLPQMAAALISPTPHAAVVKEKAANATANEPPSQSPIGIPAIHSSVANHPAPQAAPQSDTWAKWGVVVNLVLVVITVVIALTGLIQALAARDSAKAAFLNAEAVINAERAWLLFAVEKERTQGVGETAIFHINVVNYGKVPARRLKISKPRNEVKALADLAELSPAEYGDALEDTREWLAPGEACRVATFYPYQMRNKMVEAAQSCGVNPEMIAAIVYGQVVYEDGISPNSRHSRYCYVHDKEPFRNIGGSLRTIGPDEYLQCT